MHLVVILLAASDYQLLHDFLLQGFFIKNNWKTRLKYHYG